MALSRDGESFEAFEELVHIWIGLRGNTSTKDQRYSKTVGISGVSNDIGRDTSACDSQNRQGCQEDRLAFVCSPILDMERMFLRLECLTKSDTFSGSFAIVGHTS